MLSLFHRIFSLSCHFAVAIFYQINKSGSQWMKGTAFWTEPVLPVFEHLGSFSTWTCMLILGSFHWRKKIVNFLHYETFTNMILWLWLWTVSNKLWSMVSTLVDHHSIIHMQLLIILSLKSISRYILYHEASFMICIVSWGECIVAAIMSCEEIRIKQALSYISFCCI